MHKQPRQKSLHAIFRAQSSYYQATVKNLKKIIYGKCYIFLVPIRKDNSNNYYPKNNLSRLDLVWFLCK